MYSTYFDLHSYPSHTSEPGIHFHATYISVLFALICAQFQPLSQNFGGDTLFCFPWKRKLCFVPAGVQSVGYNGGDVARISALIHHQQHNDTTIIQLQENEAKIAPLILV